MKKGVNLPLQMDPQKFAEHLQRRFGSAEKIAAELRVPLWRVRLWEHGGDIYPEQLFRLADALRCPMLSLLPDDFNG